MNQLAMYGIQARQMQSSLLKSLNSLEALGRAQGLQELGVERAEVLFPSLPGWSLLSTLPGIFTLLGDQNLSQESNPCKTFEIQIRTTQLFLTFHYEDNRTRGKHSAGVWTSRGGTGQCPLLLLCTRSLHSFLYSLLQHLTHCKTTNTFQPLLLAPCNPNFSRCC